MHEEQLRRIFDETKTIAVVGASTDPEKPSHEIPRYLAGQGYRVIPVSPRGGELFGEPVRPSLEDIDAPVDVVNVFRPAEEAARIARAAAAIGAKLIWFQHGTQSEEGIRVAQEAGMGIVAGWCMATTHGALGLGPGPWRGI